MHDVTGDPKINENSQVDVVGTLKKKTDLTFLYLFSPIRVMRHDLNLRRDFHYGTESVQPREYSMQKEGFVVQNAF